MERGGEKSFEKKKKSLFCFIWNKSSIFFITAYLFFYPSHEISRDIIGNSNSINEHSQLLH